MKRNESIEDSIKQELLVLAALSGLKAPKHNITTCQDDRCEGSAPLTGRWVAQLNRSILEIRNPCEEHFHKYFDGSYQEWIKL